MKIMDYSELVDSYIRKSGMSLAEIAERMKNEKGVKVDRTYISKLRNNPKYAASDEINQAFAEVTGGDPFRLVWAGLIYGSHPSVRDILMLIDDEVVIKAMSLTKKYPGYFHLTEEKQEELENEPDVRDFWDSLSSSMDKAKTKNVYEFKSNNNDDISSVYEQAMYSYESMIKVPVLGCIQAGQPIEMLETNEGYTLVDPNTLRGKQGFALKVKGDSMIGDRIQDGDIVIVAKQEEVHPHEIAVVAVNGDHATLKRVKRHGNMCLLVPSNPTMEPQLIPAEDVHIIGKVVEVKFWPK
jgi:SOS regulatory protein LexA